MLGLGLQRWKRSFFVGLFGFATKLRGIIPMRMRTSNKIPLCLVIITCVLRHHHLPHLFSLLHLLLMPDSPQPAFIKDSLEAGGSTSMAAGLHTAVQNMATVQLFVWIVWQSTTIIFTSELYLNMSSMLINYL